MTKSNGRDRHRRGSATVPKPPHASPHAVARFEPRNASQRLAQRLYHQSDILFLTGPAGCGKTWAAIALAAVDILSGGPRTKIVAIRPAVEAGEKLGFLPGSPGEKIHPYTQPVRHTLSRVAFGLPADSITYDAMAYIRGVSYDNSVIVLDESQNADHRQLTLVISRLGRDSKLIITGDPSQSDIRSTGAFKTDLDEVIEKLRSLRGIGVVEFPENESLRNEKLGPILKALSCRK